ncbi:MOZ SAS family protein [Rutstroemia sp. NJR-2017a WRK4]|nr:MOZ SAS family protein [Rutstroemia sp. NJR-2017a WRK4]
MSTTTTRSGSRSLRFRPGRESYGMGIADLGLGASRASDENQTQNQDQDHDTIMVEAAGREAFPDRGGVKRRRIGNTGREQDEGDEEGVDDSINTPETKEPRERRGRKSTGPSVVYGKTNRNAENMAKARAARRKRSASMRNEESGGSEREGRGIPVRERGRGLGRGEDVDMGVGGDAGDTITINLHNSLPSPPAEDEGSSIEVDNRSVSTGAVGGGRAGGIDQKPVPQSKGSGAKREKSVGDETKEKEKERERNIKEVVFGDICFKSWYSSWYPREIIGVNHGAGELGGGHVGSGEVTKGNKSGKGNGKGGGGAGTGATQVERLWVCGWCFAYSLSRGEMGVHREVCRRRVEGPPGRRIYVHDEGGGDADEVGDGEGEEKGEWSVWEVDGEEEVTFSQSLSLFAKLFLDNKSVFYDTTSFNYFLLVHSTRTPNRSSPSSSSPPTNHQIIGFFSKEKMSWDNNNLACILIFPPWQKKGFGALLMGISYAIARREGILGGPEKPISELGRKGYARFWGGEVARWVLGLEEEKGKGKGTPKGKGGKGLGKGWRKGMKGVGMNGRVSAGAAGTPVKQVEVEDVVRRCGTCTVEGISKGTWIAVEDCLGVLRGMGVLEGGDGGVDAKGEGEGEVSAQKEVKIDKEKIRAWVEREGISLEKTVYEEGFVEGYGYPEVDEEDEEDEEGESAEEEDADSADELS